MGQPRKYGMFTTKGTSERKVRSVRLTDETWEKLKAVATTEEGQTVADWLEWLFQNNIYDLLNNQLGQVQEENAAYEQKIATLQRTIDDLEGDIGALNLQILNLKDQMEHPEEQQPRITPEGDNAIQLLIDACNLPANKGGAIKTQIKRAIHLLGG